MEKAVSSTNLFHTCSRMIRLYAVCNKASNSYIVGYNMLDSVVVQIIHDFINKLLS